LGASPEGLKKKKRSGKKGGMGEEEGAKIAIKKKTSQ